MSRTWSGVALYKIDMMKALMATLLPAPVEPAISRWGIPARSATTMRPLMSLPSASVSFDFWPMNSLRFDILAQPDDLAFAVRDLNANR